MGLLRREMTLLAINVSTGVLVREAGEKSSN